MSDKCCEKKKEDVVDAVDFRHQPVPGAAAKAQVTSLWVDEKGRLKMSQPGNVGKPDAGLVVGHHPSDSRLKTNIVNLPLGLDTINELVPRRFTYEGEDTVGMVAQEILENTNLSEWCRNLLAYNTWDQVDPNDPYSPQDRLAIRYPLLIPILCQAVKDLSALVDGLRTDLTAAQAALAALDAQVNPPA